MMNTVDDDHLHGGGGVEREKLFFFLSFVII